jgi:signal transduction histidine kinase
MEEQQRRAEKLQAAATTAAQVKRDFLAFIGHECRNPLNALFNVTDFLHDTGYSLDIHIVFPILSQLFMLLYSLQSLD